MATIHNRHKARTVGYLSIALAITIIAVVLYRNSDRRTVPLVFAPKPMLETLWARYKDTYLEKGTLRTLDKQQNNVTTSEGESYTMLRSVWMDDQATFDTSWKWVKDNMARKNDHLISWLFGERANGSYGVITERGGQNTASDADVDIALALLFAGNRWSNDTYTGDAITLIDSIWKEEVVTIRGRPYLAADNIEKNSNDLVLVNPSYFAPYAYRIFAEIDTHHDWKGLVDTSYEVMKESMEQNLNASSTDGLPPDWIGISRKNARLSTSLPAPLSTDYSFDALRIPWKIALDYKWNNDPRARNILLGMHFLGDEYRKNGALFSRYSHDGEVKGAYEIPSMYGGSIGYFIFAELGVAEKIYKEKLLSLYNPDTQSWKIDLGYYDSNWVWFGMALYNDLVPDLFIKK